MANNVSWGIAAPQVFLDGPVDMSLISKWTQKAEELGYHSLWVQEQIVGDVPILEPVNLLSYMAAITQKVKYINSSAAATTAAALKPKCSKTSAPGPDAPKVGKPTTLPSSPTHFRQ